MEFAVTLQQQAMNKPCLGVSLVKSSGLGYESPRRKLDSCRMVKTRVQASKIRRERRPQNNDGDYYVDNGCIDCDTCRWMAPRTFERIDERSAVYSQPNSAEERLKALQALISCPTASIHTESPPDISQVQMLFPLPLDEKSLSGVYLCGYHSDKSHGATSYFIVHPKGNILVGSPRYSECLAHNLEGLGGARYMFLTHSDDVPDHARWAKRLQCDRILHMREVKLPTADVELILEGQGPWSIFSDFDLIFTPGHTEGSVSLFYKPLKALFTGDQLTVSTDNNLNPLEESNEYSVSRQVGSIQRLLQLDFLWILPGHGKRLKFKDFKEKNVALERFLASCGRTFQSC